MEGHGIYRWVDGRMYDGEWKDNQPPAEDLAPVLVRVARAVDTQADEAAHRRSGGGAA